MLENGWSGLHPGNTRSLSPTRVFIWLRIASARSASGTAWISLAFIRTAGIVQADVAAAALRDDAQQPAPSAGRINNKIVSIAVRVAAGLVQLPNRDRGE